MDYAAEYQRKLTTPENAVARIPHGATLVVGIAVSEPPALLEVPPRPALPEDAGVGQLIAAEIPDGATLQLGIGGIPDAVARSLDGRKDLGIHAEAKRLRLV
jgi:itaconate CoA-transferase